jgi:hypothetical protein
MAKKISITRELIQATNISRRRRSESEQTYLNRIVLEVGGLSDDIRVNPSPEAQAWYAAAVEAINPGEMIPSPDARDETDEAAQTVITGVKMRRGHPKKMKLSPPRQQKVIKKLSV